MIRQEPNISLQRCLRFCMWGDKICHCLVFILKRFYCTRGKKLIGKTKEPRKFTFCNSILWLGFIVNGIPWAQIYAVHGALRITEIKYRLFWNRCNKKNWLAWVGLPVTFRNAVLSAKNPFTGPLLNSSCQMAEGP